MHDHEYDETGRLLRTVVTREPEWDGDERAWMLGLALREHAECHRCGGDLHETLDHEAWKWQPEAPLVCSRCVALDAVARKFEKHPERAGLIHRVAKRPRPKRQKRG